VLANTVLKNGKIGAKIDRGTANAETSRLDAAERLR
jgi:hypothetical protein